MALYFISNWLKFPSGKFGNGEPNRKSWGVMALKSSILSLVGVRGYWLITDSTWYRKVVNETSVNARSCVIAPNVGFTDLAEDFQTPPIHGLMGAFNFHSFVYS